MPYGRGGAGNIEALNQKRADDLEAQRSKAEDNLNKPSLPADSTMPPSSPTPTPTPIPAPIPANLNQDYAHMGRGGAGNWYSPKDLSQTGKFETSPEQASGEGKPIDQEMISDTRHRGRGGAGNFIWSAEDEEKARQEKQEMEIELKDMVVKDVEKGLARPDRAFIRQWDE